MKTNYFFIITNVDRTAAARHPCSWLTQKLTTSAFSIQHLNHMFNVHLLRELTIRIRETINQTNVHVYRKRNRTETAAAPFDL